MKHYLDLVPIFAKVHRRQSRMSVLCILLSVFLVTAIFGIDREAKDFREYASRSAENYQRTLEDILRLIRGGSRGA